MRVSRYIDKGWQINLISLLWLFEADDNLTIRGNLQAVAKKMTTGHHDFGHDIIIGGYYFEGRKQLSNCGVLLMYKTSKLPLNFKVETPDYQWCHAASRRGLLTQYSLRGGYNDRFRIVS